MSKGWPQLSQGFSVILASFRGLLFFFFLSLRTGPVCAGDKTSKGDSQISQKICEQERIGGRQDIFLKVCVLK